jgi:hypothetical protein
MCPNYVRSHVNEFAVQNVYSNSANPKPNSETIVNKAPTHLFNLP